MTSLAAGLMMMGSLFGLHETVYSMDSMTVSGDSLYLVKMDVYYAPNIPIPERGGDVVLKKDYEVVKLDLSGKKQRLSSTSYQLMPKRPPNDDSLSQAGGYYGYIELNDKAQATLWGKPELKERLFKGIKTDCAVEEFDDVAYDGQDARVLYLYCPRTDTAYRFELPEMNVVAIPFGRAHNPESPNHCPTFYSVRGQKAIFADVNGVMYELNTDALDSRKKMEMLEQGIMISSQRSKKSLIGVAQGLRIYQVQQSQTNSVQLSIEYQGQPARLFPLPNALVDMFGPVVYLPQSNLVFWDSWFEDKDYHIIYTFNIETSIMRRAKIPK